MYMLICGDMLPASIFLTFKLFIAPMRASPLRPLSLANLNFPPIYSLASHLPHPSPTLQLSHLTHPHYTTNPDTTYAQTWTSSASTSSQPPNPPRQAGPTSPTPNLPARPLPRANARATPPARTTRARGRTRKLQGTWRRWRRRGEGGRWLFRCL